MHRGRSSATPLLEKLRAVDALCLGGSGGQKKEQPKPVCSPGYVLHERQRCCVAAVVAVAVDDGIVTCVREMTPLFRASPFSRHRDPPHGRTTSCALHRLRQRIRARSRCTLGSLRTHALLLNYFTVPRTRSRRAQMFRSSNQLTKVVFTTILARPPSRHFPR